MVANDLHRQRAIFQHASDLRERARGSDTASRDHQHGVCKLLNFGQHVARNEDRLTAIGQTA
jgi:hypothetical protein